MKNFLIFLFLLVFIICEPSDLSTEEIRKRRKILEQDMINCIIKSGSATNEFKREIEKKEGDKLRLILRKYLSKLDTNDRFIIKKCRREIFLNLRKIKQ